MSGKDEIEGFNDDSYIVKYFDRVDPKVFARNLDRNMKANNIEIDLGKNLAKDKDLLKAFPPKTLNKLEQIGFELESLRNQKRALIVRVTKKIRKLAKIIIKAMLKLKDKTLDDPDLSKACGELRSSKMQALRSIKKVKKLGKFVGKLLESQRGVGLIRK